MQADVQDDKMGISTMRKINEKINRGKWVRWGKKWDKIKKNKKRGRKGGQDLGLIKSIIKVIPVAMHPIGDIEMKGGVH